MRLRKPHVDGQEIRESFQPKLWFRLIVLSLVVAYVVAFGAENTRHVNIHFVVATANVSLIWVVALSLVIGLLVGLLASQLTRHRRRRARGE